MFNKNSEMNDSVSNLDKAIVESGLANEEDLEHTLIDELHQHLQEIVNDDEKILKSFTPTNNEKSLLVKVYQDQIKSIISQFENEHSGIKVQKTKIHVWREFNGETFRVSLEN